LNKLLNGLLVRESRLINLSWLLCIKSAVCFLGLTSIMSVVIVIHVMRNKTILYCRELFVLLFIIYQPAEKRGSIVCIFSISIDNEYRWYMYQGVSGCHNFFSQTFSTLQYLLCTSTVRTAVPGTLQENLRREHIITFTIRTKYNNIYKQHN
jgi:hypothetical protein